MQIRLLALPVLVLSLLLGACQNPFSGSSPKVGVVDLSRLVTDSNPGKAARTFLENMQKDFNDRLTSLSKQAQDNQKDEKAAQQLQSTYMNLQQRMQAEEQNVNNALLEHVLSVIKKYREQNGLTVILRSEAALDYDKSLDVTEQLLAEVNKQNIEFKPVTHDEKPQAAPAAGSDKRSMKLLPRLPPPQPTARPGLRRLLLRAGPPRSNIF